MLMNITISVAVTFAAALANSAMAQLASDADYLCTVHEAYDVTADGKLESKSTTHKFLIGQRFSVERTTGAMAGDVKHGTYSEITVLDPGSDEQSYKVVGVSKAQYMYLDYLEIKEYADSPNKPFIFRSRTGIRTGTCVYF